MLPLTEADDAKQRDDDDERGGGWIARGDAGSPALSEVIAWGSLAECVTSVCCPPIVVGRLDVTATALNVCCPLLGGMAQAVDDAATGGDPAVVRRIAAFQTGFIGVATSFSFMAEQASFFESGQSSLTYILASVGAGCIAFSTGRWLIGRALRPRHLRRAIRTGSALPSPSLIRRGLSAAVIVTWVWVLLAPAGAVFDPLAIRADRLASGRSGRGLQAIEPAPPSKRSDVLHLALGLAMQASGLAASSSLQAMLEDSRRFSLRGVRGAPLLSNALACAVLIAVRVGEAAAVLHPDAPVTSKLRTSGCGALSFSGGLVALVVAGRGTRGHALANVALHAGVAGVACFLLPRLTAWAVPG
jgi:fluoride ion exporter CrcB/FEX